MSISMAIPALWSVYEYWYTNSPWRQGAEVIQAFIYAMGIGTGSGVLLCLLGVKSHGHLGKREVWLWNVLVYQTIVCSWP